MITKIIIASAKNGELTQMIEDFGVYFITSSNEINKEIAKYKCPFRLSAYIDELKATKQINEVDEIAFDNLFDLSDETNIIADEILRNNYDYDKYIEQTPYLNKYGYNTILEDVGDDYLQHETDENSLKLYVK
ncbi:MAG: hypothetical protein L3J10_04305 [Sulfurimonas sp.]|nr:hypothetical protein [Sulfurimonas sp.]